MHFCFLLYVFTRTKFSRNKRNFLFQFSQLRKCLENVFLFSSRFFLAGLLACRLASPASQQACKRTCRREKRSVVIYTEKVVVLRPHLPGTFLKKVQKKGEKLLATTKKKCNLSIKCFEDENYGYFKN